MLIISKSQSTHSLKKNFLIKKNISDQISDHVDHIKITINPLAQKNQNQQYTYSTHSTLTKNKNIKKNKNIPNQLRPRAGVAGGTRTERRRCAAVV